MYQRFILVKNQKYIFLFGTKKSPRTAGSVRIDLQMFAGSPHETLAPPSSCRKTVTFSVSAMSSSSLAQSSGDSLCALWITARLAF